MTSWLIYSCKPTSEEEKFIKSNIAKINQKNPDSLGDLPFVSVVDLEGVQDQIQKLGEEDELEADKIKEDIPTVEQSDVVTIIGPNWEVVATEVEGKPYRTGAFLVRPERRVGAGGGIGCGGGDGESMIGESALIGVEGMLEPLAGEDSSDSVSGTGVILDGATELVNSGSSSSSGTLGDKVGCKPGKVSSW
ncbi:uncharacterized protein MELLADRAFT_110565 [Melampsora larici-populina 98AG31]|uniref:Uncharacterized protein n=1 Tax=Melampsora larici-populina (strain 98AG31 / pathotype 3-4-7) TaxID=747676 RepID=F4S082_MELLP|nr:uncharacterized protein MELLADRAFT_110565 [Melampsora larici-populina 98AG31]EGG01981.1 hypothetical protein MELLADRAFT_110565 [Melampsora larici-populina 98AG31]